MNERMVVIVNPASGSAGEDFRATIEAALRRLGADFEVRETTPERNGGALAEEAVREGVTHLVACGGDGTVMSIVNGVGKSDLSNPEGKDGGEQSDEGEQADESDGTGPNAAEPRVTVSIIPGGTANLLATALELPTGIDEAVEVAVSGRDRVVDLGRCGEVLFALGLGLGLTERLVSQTSARDKERLGRLAYARAMLRELGTRPHWFTYKLDDRKPKRARGVAIVVANSGQIGGSLRFAPRAKMDDGLIDLCILHRFYLRDFVRMVGRALLGRLQEDRAVSFHQARRIEIRSDPPLDLQIDGEEVDLMTPLVAEVIPRALRVRVKDEG